VPGEILKYDLHFYITKYIKKTYNSEIATVQQERGTAHSARTAARCPSIKH